MLTGGCLEELPDRTVANELAKGVAKGSFTTAGDMLAETGKSIADFLKIMLEPTNWAGADLVPENPRKK